MALLAWLAMALQPWAREGGREGGSSTRSSTLPLGSPCRRSVRPLLSRAPGLSPGFIPFPDDSLHPQPLPPPRTFIPRAILRETPPPQSYPFGFLFGDPCSPSLSNPEAWVKSALARAHLDPSAATCHRSAHSQQANCCAQDLASAAFTPPHTRTPNWSPEGGDFSRPELREQFDPLPEALVSGQPCFLVDTPVLFAS